MPTYLPTLFSTNQILDIRNGNNSLEKSLSLITGGNVTVKELRSPETPNEPITIVTMVRYQNENSSLLIHYVFSTYKLLISMF